MACEDMKKALAWPWGFASLILSEEKPWGHLVPEASQLQGRREENS